MRTDWKALCAELAGCLDDALTFTVQSDTERSMRQLIARARTALAQPEPEGVTDEEIMALMPQQLQDDLATVSRLAAYGTDVGPGLYRVSLNTGILNHCRAVLQRWGRPAIEPVPVSERLPEPHMKVIAHYLNDLGNSRTILAEWVPAKSRTDDCLVDDDFAEYDEEADEYYWPEGWYESIENWDDYGAVFVHEGVITHWQPLPRGPHHALPVPTTHK